MNASSESKDQAKVEFVSLVAGAQRFCVEVSRVREIRRWSPITPIPRAPDCLLGVMNLRGAVIPIFDLAHRLGLQATRITSRHVVIIVAASGERRVGLLVDSVAEILKVSRDTLRSTPIVPGAAPQIVQGMIAIEGETLRILDVEALAPMLAETAT